MPTDSSSALQAPRLFVCVVHGASARPQPSTGMPGLASALIPSKQQPCRLLQNSLAAPARPLICAPCLARSSGPVVIFTAYLHSPACAFTSTLAAIRVQVQAARPQRRSAHHQHSAGFVTGIAHAAIGCDRHAHACCQQRMTSHPSRAQAHGLGLLERDGAVHDQRAGLGVGVHGEVAQTLQLEAVAQLRVRGTPACACMCVRKP
jgi:hypothetical protein